MLIFDAPKFMNLLTIMLDCQKTLQFQGGAMPDHILANQPKISAMLEQLCGDLHLPVSKVAASRIGTASDGQIMFQATECLLFDLQTELSQKKFFAVDPNRFDYYQSPKLFGPEVFDNFSSANDDIFEAGTCLALERGTACVMHLNRVMEAGLKVLAATLGVGAQNDWGKYLNGIDVELESRYKNAGARTTDEKSYAEARIHFDAVRRAWRNPTMHVGKDYSLEKAEEILIAVRSFMRHLALIGLKE